MDGLENGEGPYIQLYIKFVFKSLYYFLGEKVHGFNYDIRVLSTIPQNLRSTVNIHLIHPLKNQYKTPNMFTVITFIPLIIAVSLTRVTPPPSTLPFNFSYPNLLEIQDQGPNQIFSYHEVSAYSSYPHLHPPK